MALAIFGGGALDVFHFLVLVAVLFQVPTLPLVLEEMPAPVGVAWVWFVASAAFLAWEEYRKLRTVRDSTVANRRFGEMAAPYAAVENVRLQRVVVLVAVLAMLLAVLVALPTMVSLLADGASVIDWLRGVFGPPVPSDAR